MVKGVPSKLAFFFFLTRSTIADVGQEAEAKASQVFRFMLMALRSFLRTSLKRSWGLPVGRFSVEEILRDPTQWLTITDTIAS